MAGHVWARTRGSHRLQRMAVAVLLVCLVILLAVTMTAILAQTGNRYILVQCPASIASCDSRTPARVTYTVGESQACKSSTCYC